MTYEGESAAIEKPISSPSLNLAVVMSSIGSPLSTTHSVPPTYHQSSFISPKPSIVTPYLATSTGEAVTMNVAGVIVVSFGVTVTVYS